MAGDGTEESTPGRQRDRPVSGDRKRPALTLCAALLLAGCATQGTVSTTEPNDPFEPVNRAMYKLNDLGDRYLLRPMAVGYERALPLQIRSGVRNIFSNLLYPVTIVNDLLQGKWAQTGRDGARFVVNSTIGLAGIFDPATRIGLTENDEDFGQTLGKWGVAEGPYLVIPVFGPRTVRDGVGSLADLPLTPFLAVFGDETSVRLGAYVLYSVDGRSRLLDVDQQVFDAFDPYAFVRDAYLQNRRYRVLDGNVPEDADLYPEDFDDDEGE
ncbi:MAG: VacJ family lipoprotein [Gammaproteobacteria bacterium]|nr:VacJ family lipoprotein [Gammaproteobacteria bacterium]